MADGEWCLEGRTDDSGWCPTVVSKARAFALETLDLSGNNMKGEGRCGVGSVAITHVMLQISLAYSIIGVPSKAMHLALLNRYTTTLLLLGTYCPGLKSISKHGRLPVAGQLPLQWAQLFPSLQFLMIQRNQLYSGSEQKPAALPTEWTRRTVPRAFPQLEALVMYPGNTYICNLPDVEGGFQEVNGGEWWHLVCTCSFP